jgi:hypothetical protein
LLVGNQGHNAKVGAVTNPRLGIVLIAEALRRLGFKVMLIRDAGHKSMDIGIIRMHDFQQATAKAAPELLKELRAKSYRVVHVQAKAPLASLPE